VKNVARALRKLNLCPQVETEGSMWRFLGIWSKNRSEWLMTLLAAMHMSTTTVGFFDAMSDSAVEFILN